MTTNRRHFLAGLSAIAPLSYFAPTASATTESSKTTPPDYFPDLGVHPFINAVGPYSSLGGAQMWPEVIDAMDYAIKNKARMSDLHDAVGKRIAEMTGVESAMVTSGATNAIILATIACMTMGDEEKMERLPDASSMPSEVIMLKSQRYLYDRSIRAPGATLIEVETAADVRAAINPNTAMLFYLLNRPDDLKIEVSEYVALAREFDIPIMCDAATTVPPVGNIAQTVATGFDLICYSGGKGLRGPYSAGLLLGRKDLIHIARQNASPNHRAYGRSMKVAPEEYLGMMVAVETSLKFDEKAEFQRQLQIVNEMGHTLSSVPGVNTVTHIPGAEAREPYIEVQWDVDQYNIGVAEMKQALRDSRPSIEIRALFLSNGELHLTAAMLKEGEPDIVTRQVAEILRSNA
jgi:L-seryl-tRNA(Ser) seleniumtransferase